MVTGFPPDLLELWKQGAELHHIPPPARMERDEDDRESVRERERERDESEIGVLREVRVHDRDLIKC